MATFQNATIFWQISSQTLSFIRFCFSCEERNYSRSVTLSTNNTILHDDEKPSRITRDMWLDILRRVCFQDRETSFITRTCYSSLFLRLARRCLSLRVTFSSATIIAEIKVKAVLCNSSSETRRETSFRIDLRSTTGSRRKKLMTAVGLYPPNDDPSEFLSAT